MLAYLRTAIATGLFTTVLMTMPVCAKPNNGKGNGSPSSKDLPAAVAFVDRAGDAVISDTGQPIVDGQDGAEVTIFNSGARMQTSGSRGATITLGHCLDATCESPFGLSPAGFETELRLVLGMGNPSEGERTFFPAPNVTLSTASPSLGFYTEDSYYRFGWDLDTSNTVTGIDQDADGTSDAWLWTMDSQSIVELDKWSLKRNGTLKDYLGVVGTFNTMPLQFTFSEVNTATTANAVPEPSGLILILIGVAFAARRV